MATSCMDKVAVNFVALSVVISAHFFFYLGKIMSCRPSALHIYLSAAFASSHFRRHKWIREIHFGMVIIAKSGH